jgi:hypothetical protein
VSGRGRRVLLACALAGLLLGAVRSVLADGRPFLLVVAGLGGESYYSDLFRRWAQNLLAVAHQHLGIPDADTLYLAEDPAHEPQGADGPATRAALLDALAEIARRSAPGDRVLVVLLGHGTAQGPVVRYNLVGPDLAPEQLADALEALHGRQVALVNTTPASGPFLVRLSAPGRVVITATASGAESQHTRFAGFFIDALASPEADADKDGTVSLLEAFHYANRLVADAYAADRRLLTEHALLDDNGDRAGSKEPDPASGDGALAARLHFAGRQETAPEGDPGQAAARLALQLEAQRLVDDIERLKREKLTLAGADYERRLEDLLVELALNRRRYRAEAVQ